VGLDRLVVVTVEQRLRIVGLVPPATDSALLPLVVPVAGVRDQERVDPYHDSVTPWSLPADNGASLAKASANRSMDLVA
jgi:hypothetical protein